MTDDTKPEAVRVEDYTVLLQCDDRIVLAKMNDEMTLVEIVITATNDYTEFIEAKLNRSQIAHLGGFFGQAGGVIV